MVKIWPCKPYPRMPWIQLWGCWQVAYDTAMLKTSWKGKQPRNKIWCLRLCKVETKGKMGPERLLVTMCIQVNNIDHQVKVSFILFLKSTESKPNQICNRLKIIETWNNIETSQYTTVVHVILMRTECYVL